MSIRVIRLPIDIVKLSLAKPEITIKQLAAFAAALGGTVHQPLHPKDMLSIELRIDWDVFIASAVASEMMEDVFDPSPR